MLDGYQAKPLRRFVGADLPTLMSQVERAKGFAMDSWEREKRDRQLASDRDAYVTTLSTEGLRQPDELGATYAKWIAGETQVIVRVDLRGFATVDAYWTDADGIRDRFIAPKDVRSTTWLARDIERLLSGPVTRELVMSVSKP